MKNNFLSDNIKPLLAIIIVVFCFAYFFLTAFGIGNQNPQVLIAIVAVLSAATGYYFGSSSGSAKKDEAIVNQLSTPTATITGDSPKVNVNP